MEYGKWLSVVAARLLCGCLDVRQFGRCFGSELEKKGQLGAPVQIQTPCILDFHSSVSLVPKTNSIYTGALALFTGIASCRILVVRCL